MAWLFWSIVYCVCRVLALRWQALRCEVGSTDSAARRRGLQIGGASRREIPPGQKEVRESVPSVS